MKCIQCGTDNNLKARTRYYGRCQSCNHPFTFEPTGMGTNRFTDAFFEKAIADLSVNRTLFFTPKQFFYFMDQRLKREKVGNLFTLLIFFYLLSIFVGILVGICLTSFIGSIVFPLIFIGFNFLLIYYLFLSSNSLELSRQARRSYATRLQLLGILILVVGVAFGVVGDPELFGNHALIYYYSAALMGLGALGLGLFQKQRIATLPKTPRITAAQRIATLPEMPRITANQLQDWLDRWARVNGSIPQLLPSPSSTLSPSSQDITATPEVTAYSFDRLIVCQTDAIAQMLIANNVHFENNCAILSISGYPQRIFDTTMQMLRRNPELRVFAFHDCSPQGTALVHQLRTNPNWFPDETIAIVDVGLLPRQILATKRNIILQASQASAQAAQNLAPAVRQGLSSVELQWLEAGYFVELESFSPRTLIQVLQRSIANSQQLNRIEGTTEDSTFILVGDGGGSFYATESFG